MRFIAAVAALAIAQPCFAQTEAPRPGPPPGLPADAGAEGWTLTLGVAPVVTPAWQGSRDMTLSLFPDLRINYKDVLFASIPDGLGWNAIRQDGWTAGPLAKIRFSRDEKRGGSPFLVAGGSDALQGMGNVGAAAELGGFVEKRGRSWRTRVEVRRGFGGHEGVIADVSAGYRARAGRAIVGVAPRATLASKAYIHTYFGIDPIQSQRTGLQHYSPRGGLLSYGVGGTVIRPLDRHSAVTLFTGVDRLGGEAGQSPLVRDRGSRTQFTFGLGYGYRFNL